MIALGVAKLIFFFAAKRNFSRYKAKKKNGFVERGFDQFRRLEVREKIKHVFVMSLSLCHHQGMTQHRIITFFQFR